MLPTVSTPYAGRGFVPNFANRQFATGGKKGPKPVMLDVTMGLPAKDIGIVTEKGSSYTPITFSQQVMGPKGIPRLRGMLPPRMFNGADGKRLDSLMLRASPVPVVPIFPVDQKSDKASDTVGEFPSLQKSFNDYADNISRQLFPNARARRFNMHALSKGTEGDIFEEGLRAAVGEQALADRTAAFDYNGPNFAHKDLIKFVNAKGAGLRPTRSKLEA